MREFINSLTTIDYVVIGVVVVVVLAFLFWPRRWRGRSSRSSGLWEDLSDWGSGGGDGGD